MATVPTSSSQRVKVFVRARPTPYFASEFITIRDKVISIQLPVSPRRINQQAREWNFLVDGILSNSSQEEVYAACAHDVVSGVMNGVNGTIFAYGQTGAGKTYTMSGEPQYRLRGIIPRALSQIYNTVRERDDCTTIVRISCLEIYNETLTDLLGELPKSDQGSLSLSENEKGTSSVKGLSVRVADNEEEALNMFFEAEKNRLVGEHALNKQCSRSHIIFTINVECHSAVSASSEYTISKLHLVDLAGSERLGIADHSGTIVTETIYINKSLSFLEQVVMALTEKRRAHVPYRHCKLTQLLKGSIGGNCNSVMIANIWGEREHLENTLGTLRFSERIMCVCADPQRNIHYNPVGLIQKYERDIKALKEEMAMQELLHGKQSSKTSVTAHLTEGQVANIKDGVKNYIAGTTNTLEFNSIREIKETFSQFKEYINTMKKDYQEELSKLQEQLSKVDASLSGPIEEKPVKPTKGGKFNLRKNTGAASPTTAETEAEDYSDKKQEVGVSDGQGYGIGQAPGDVANTKLGKKRISFLPKLAISADQKKKFGKGQNLSSDAQEFCIDEDTSGQPYSPPSRVEAFELFKKGRGKEINRIFLQNKDLLQRKRKAAYDVSCKLNQLKQKIDKLRRKLVDKKKGQMVTATTSDGRQILDSEEYNYLKELQEAKREYKSQYAILEGLKLDIPYCDQYTQQSRQKLADEFDTWYKLAFIGDKPSQASGEETSATSSPIEPPETSRFKDLQSMALLQGDPSTMAFYYAQLRTGKRSITERRATIRKKTSMILSH
ncbi:PREDICTED: kinesin-like protein KIF9 isoform X2 [Amphimedon queenslandica]|uniref:Kinesin-like protein n=1 Tax=Amphimedon queenslandica TaxID=400682 RepID=A0AAN0J1K3_AMPQE|nr:PREDICTED: kinesin-like protein KIF9 isoform X2 [Amphimedon queenslandica]|eukprot:XP_019850613.1 PREDICTED: kinesin-like protein KIF9 isoform X2 [Amphimedon queenslandica]